MSSIADRMNESEASVSVLVVRRTVKASLQRTFDAWTTPEQIKQWWGPKGIVCTEAEIDLKVGGKYRIANLSSDGTTLWISGEFEEIVAPDRLVYTWKLDSLPESIQRVTVRFEPVEDGTEIVILHERVPESVRDTHEQGWNGCLDGLIEFLGAEL